jgi:conjugal transfer/entry exclusion protein
MEIEDLRQEMDARFQQVDQRFQRIDERFEQVDQRFEQVVQLILSEGERTRRHFDAVAEQLKAERNQALDQSAAAVEQVGRLRAVNAADQLQFERRLDDHEARLTRLERQKE